MMGTNRRTIPALAVAAATLLAACGGGGPTTPDTSPTTPADLPLSQDLHVTLREWSVTTSEPTAQAGDVTIQATNEGPDHEHELVVIATDLLPGGLPTDEDGAVDEDAPEVEVVDEIEGIEPGGQKTRVFTLEPGTYALICNIVEKDKGDVVAHYRMGMFTGFEVT